MKPEFKKRLQELTAQDDRNRKDPRFLGAMGFLVAKGFLAYNRPILKKPNAKLAIRDVIWAGEHVEPRILEVLPAAFIRFERHFTLAPKPNAEENLLLEIRDALRNQKKDAPEFKGIPYAKYAIWLDLKLKDRRTQTHSNRKRMKAFRLHPDAISKLAKLAGERHMSEAEILEEMIEKQA